MKGLLKLSGGVWLFILGNIEVSLRVFRRKQTWSNLVFRKVTVDTVKRIDENQARPRQGSEPGGCCNNSG